MKILKYSLPLLIVAMLIVPTISMAMRSPTDLNANANLAPPGVLTNSTIGTKNMDDVTQGIVNLRNWFAGIFVILAVGIILIGAFMYMTSGGDATKTTKARGWIIGGIIGIVIAAFAFGIFSFVSTIISDIMSN